MSQFFESTAELRVYVSQSAGLTFEKWNPCQEPAIENYFHAIFGETLMDEILSYKTETNPLKLKLFKITCRALSKFILLDYTDLGEVSVNDSGITRAEGAETKTAYAQQVRALKESLEDLGWGGIERMVKFLNANVATFTAWPSAPGYSFNEEMILDNPDDLVAIYYTKHPYRLHRLLKADLRRAEDLFVVKHFAAVTIAQLREIPKADLAPVQKILRGYIDQVILAQALILALKANTIKLTSDGVKIMNTDLDMAKTMNVQPDYNSMQTSISSLDAVAKKYLDDAIDLVQTDDSFPETAPEPYVSKGFHV